MNFSNPLQTNELIYLLIPFNEGYGLFIYFGVIVNKDTTLRGPKEYKSYGVGTFKRAYKRLPSVISRSFRCNYNGTRTHVA